VLAAAAPLQAAARGVDIELVAKPTLSTPWTVTYNWPTPTKQVWPSALSYTATGTGTSYFTVTVNRIGTISGGVLTGQLSVTRTSGDDSGGSGNTLTANQPIVEIWQANGAEGATVKVTQTACVYENAAPTFTFNTPGTNTRCTYTFAPTASATFQFDPEQDSELRIGSVSFTNSFPAATGFVPTPMDPFTASTTAPNRCAGVTDTMTFSTSADKPNPYNAANVVYTPFQSSGAKPPATPSTGTEVCVTTWFRYTAAFPTVTCSTSAYYVSFFCFLGGWVGG